MISSDHNSSDQDSELDFSALVRLVWHNKALICAVSLAGGLAAAAVAFTTPPVFRAEAVIVAVHEKDLSAGGFANQLGALTSLVGVSLGQPGNGQASDAMLESRRLVEEFIKRNDLMPLLSKNAKRPPTLWLAVKEFKEGTLTVRKDTRRGTTTVAVEWTDPAIAALWANGLIRLANELIRARAIDDATRNIAYLNRQLEQTNAVELRQALFDIIKNETKTLMLANGRDNYAFEIVDPAVAPERKVRPHRAIITLGGLVLGGVLGTLIAFGLDLRRRRRVLP